MLEKYNILRSAEKHVINRNLNHAIREYQLIAEQEAQDPAVLNTLGDLLLKDGRREEALTRFRRVAEIYLQNGFLSKAIAICKKIHRLDPRDDETNSRLIELFSKQGLTSEAIRHLQSLVRQCQAWGQLDSALDYQQQILDLDPNQDGEHLAAARLAHQLERNDEAQSYYLNAANLLRSRGKLNQSHDIAREGLRTSGQSRRLLVLFLETGEQLAAQLRAEGNHAEAQRLEQECSEMRTQEEFNATENQTVEVAIENPLPEANSRDSLAGNRERSSSGDLIIKSSPEVRGFDLLVEQPTEFDSGEKQEEDSRPSFAEYLFGSESEGEPAAEHKTADSTFALQETDRSFQLEPSDPSTHPDDDRCVHRAPVINPEQDIVPVQTTRAKGEAEWEGSLEEALQEADFYLKLGLRDDARDLIEKLVRAFPSDERVHQRAAKASIALPETMAAPSDLPESVVNEPYDDFGIEVESALDGLFSSDLESEPAEVLRYDVTSNGRNSKDDPRVHYDLGMAYKEMGLLGDAVEKFQEAYRLFEGQNSIAQKILCCSMLSTAYNQLEDFARAVEWSEEGLSLPDKKDFEWKALQYDRCYALEGMGETDRALEGYATILDKDPEYRDVSQRVEVLTVQVNGQ